MEALIAKKAKVDVTNEFGYTPLAEAVKQGDARMVKMLLDAGSGTEGANADGQTALMLAIKNGDLPIFQMLIDAGAKVNVVEKVQEQTPLMWAAAATRNAAEMVKVLIAKGADRECARQVHATGRARSRRSLARSITRMAASPRCCTRLAAVATRASRRLLPQAPMSICLRLKASRPMMIALDNSHNGVAKFLMEHGGNPHLWDVYGRTALYIAVDMRRRRWWRRCRGRRCWGRGAGRWPGAGGRGPASGRRPAGPGAGGRVLALGFRVLAQLRRDQVAAAPRGRAQAVGSWRRGRGGRGGRGGRRRGGRCRQRRGRRPAGFARWRSSTCCWRPAWTPIRNSTCVVPAIRAGVSVIRSSAREPRRCCAR